MVLVYLENQGESLPKGTLSAISAALQAKDAHGYSKVTGVVIGGSDASAGAL